MDPKRRFSGRVLSSSYAPAAGEPSHDGMVRELWRLLREHERDAGVTLECGTKVYYGSVAHG
ncbi:MAG: hypothetical protein M3Q49_08145 [Actinomycetota bacterium]|nr:hypothetical protein [Actinomycetota bacterium]